MPQLRLNRFAAALLCVTVFGAARVASGHGNDSLADHTHAAPAAPATSASAPGSSPAPESSEPGVRAPSPAIQLEAGGEGSASALGAYVSPSFRLLPFLAVGVTGGVGGGSTSDVQPLEWSYTLRTRWRLNAEARIYPLRVTMIDPWASVEVGAAWVHRDQTVQDTSSFTPPGATESTTNASSVMLGVGVGTDVYLLPWLTFDAGLHLRTEPPGDPASTASLLPAVVLSAGLGLHLPLGSGS